VDASSKPEVKPPCNLREVDTRGTEKEWSDNHVGYYISLPRTLEKKIEMVLGESFYSVAREKETRPYPENDILGKRVFIQTGYRDGTYLITYEVMDPELCRQICEILDTPLTPELREEAERDYQAFCRKLGV